MTQNRDGLIVRNLTISHSTARRDWVCGTCGSALTTRWHDESPHWRTVCAKDAGHPIDSFVHKSSWAYRQAKEQTEALQAQDVFNHLPPELRAAIVANT